MQDELRTLNTEITAMLRGLSSLQTQAAPRGQPDKWSIQQIVEHLLLTYRASVPAIQTRVAKGYATRASPNLRQRFAQFLITGIGRFPSGRQAPTPVAPPLALTVRSGDELAATVTAELVRLAVVTRKGESLFGRNRAVSHIVLGPLSMRHWRRFHLVHGRHHLLQIRAIRRDHAF